SSDWWERRVARIVANRSRTVVAAPLLDAQALEDGGERVAHAAALGGRVGGGGDHLGRLVGHAAQQVRQFVRGVVRRDGAHLLQRAEGALEQVQRVVEFPPPVPAKDGRGVDQRNALDGGVHGVVQVLVEAGAEA